MRPTTYKWLSRSMLLCLLVVFIFGDRLPELRALWVAMAGWAIGCALAMVICAPKLINIAVRQDHLEAKVAALIAALARAQADLDAIKPKDI